MRILAIIGLMIVMAGSAKAQQFPVFSQYLLNDFVINPAIAGSKNYIVTRLNYRKQWTGIYGSPTTQTLSGHGQIKDKPYGVGGLIYNDVTGPIRRTGIQGAFAYRIHLDEKVNRLALGLSASVFQFSFNGNDLVLHQEGDNVIRRGVESKILPDANFGAFYTGKDYYAGLSITHLFQTRIKLSDVNQSEIARLSRHFMFLGGYNIKVNNDFYLEPSLLFKAVKAAPMQLDVNAKAIFSDKFWCGLSYRSMAAVVAMLGFSVEHQWHFGYSYDFTASALRQFSGSSHELMIEYDIIETGTVLRKGKKKKAKVRKPSSKKKRKRKIKRRR